MNKLNIKVFNPQYPPTIVNNGWALDILCPKDIYVSSGAEFTIDSGLIIEMLPNAMGLISSKLKGEFSIIKGEVIHPSFQGHFSLSLKYHGASSDRISAGTPICQIVLCPIYQIGSYVNLQG